MRKFYTLQILWHSIYFFREIRCVEKVRKISTLIKLIPHLPTPWSSDICVYGWEIVCVCVCVRDSLYTILWKKFFVQTFLLFVFIILFFLIFFFSCWLLALLSCISEWIQFKLEKSFLSNHYLSLFQTF